MPPATPSRPLAKPPEYSPWGWLPRAGLGVSKSTPDKMIQRIRDAGGVVTEEVHRPDHVGLTHEGGISRKRWYWYKQACMYRVTQPTRDKFIGLLLKDALHLEQVKAENFIEENLNDLRWPANDSLAEHHLAVYWQRRRPRAAKRAAQVAEAFATRLATAQATRSRRERPPSPPPTPPADVEEAFRVGQSRPE